jgi:glyoxylase-like metal-dependent hydrolase (beta-lactamase superfamily II)
VDEYLAVAASAHSPIVAIVETHVQADHLSGAPTLAQRTGAPIYLHAAADVSFSHRGLHDGDEITLGNDFLRVLHTPGHSPDSICLLAGDRTRGPDPWFLLTGDTLLVGDAGRPDLTAEWEPASADALDGTGVQDARRFDSAALSGAAMLYESLRNLLKLPDDLEIYPAHFAGSACGRAMSGKPSSTLGFERRFNPALRPRAREEFVDFMLTDLPPAPVRHREIRAANRQGIGMGAIISPLAGSAPGRDPDVRDAGTIQA